MGEFSLQHLLPNIIMKTIRILPFCLAALALPFLLTGCNKGDDTGSTSADTNAAPAPADTNAATSTTTTSTTTSTDTNAPASTNAAPATNSGT
jgi:hypothetical protein